MVKIRLFRTGAKKRPSYRVVAIDSRRARQARVLDTLGTYQPLSGGAFEIDDAKLAKWVGNGAQLSDTVASLVRARRRASAAVVTEVAPVAGDPAPASEPTPASA